MDLAPTILVVCGFVLLCRTVMSSLDPSPRRDLCFLATNLAANFLIFCWLPRSLEFSGSAAAITFVAYLTLIAAHHQLLLRCARHRGRRAVIPVVAPIVALVLLRYVPDAANPWWQFCSRVLGEDPAIASGMY